MFWTSRATTMTIVPIFRSKDTQHRENKRGWLAAALWSALSTRRRHTLPTHRRHTLSSHWHAGTTHHAWTTHWGHPWTTHRGHTHLSGSLRSHLSFLAALPHLSLRSRRSLRRPRNAGRVNHRTAGARLLDASKTRVQARARKLSRARLCARGLQGSGAILSGNAKIFIHPNTSSANTGVTDAA